MSNQPPVSLLELFPIEADDDYDFDFDKKDDHFDNLFQKMESKPLDRRPTFKENAAAIEKEMNDFDPVADLENSMNSDDNAEERQSIWKMSYL